MLLFLDNTLINDILNMTNNDVQERQKKCFISTALNQCRYIEKLVLASWKCSELQVKRSTTLSLSLYMHVLLT